MIPSVHGLILPTVSKEVPTVLEYLGYADAGNWVDLYTPAVMQCPEAEDAYFSFSELLQSRLGNQKPQYSEYRDSRKS